MEPYVINRNPAAEAAAEAATLLAYKPGYGSVDVRSALNYWVTLATSTLAQVNA